MTREVGERVAFPLSVALAAFWQQSAAAATDPEALRRAVLQPGGLGQLLETSQNRPGSNLFLRHQTDGLVIGQWGNYQGQWRNCFQSNWRNC